MGEMRTLRPFDQELADSHFDPLGQPDYLFHYRWAKACLRVVKPGGLLLAFGGTRTWHRLVGAIEDAGWEIRDCLMWLYGQGFPKSLDISKASTKRPEPTRNRRPRSSRTSAATATRTAAARQGRQRRDSRHHSGHGTCQTLERLGLVPEAGLGTDRPGDEAARRHIRPKRPAPRRRRHEHRRLPDTLRLCRRVRREVAFSGRERPAPGTPPSTKNSQRRRTGFSPRPLAGEPALGAPSRVPASWHDSPPRRSAGQLRGPPARRVRQRGRGLGRRRAERSGLRK